MRAAPTSLMPGQEVQNANATAGATIEEVTLVMAPPTGGLPAQHVQPSESELGLAARIQQIRAAEEEEAQRLAQAEWNRQLKM